MQLMKSLRNLLKNKAILYIIVALQTTSAFALENTIEQLESFKECAYKDSGHWAVGFGQQFINGKRVVKGQCITYDEALLELTRNLDNMRERLDKWLKVNKVRINSNQRDAIILFVYNIGFTGFIESTVAEALRTGQKKLVPERLMEYTSSRGKYVKGLEERRKFEAKLFKTKVKK